MALWIKRWTDDKNVPDCSTYGDIVYFELEIMKPKFIHLNVHHSIVLYIMHELVYDY